MLGGSAGLCLAGGCPGVLTLCDQPCAGAGGAGGGERGELLQGREER